MLVFTQFRLLVCIYFDFFLYLGKYEKCPSNIFNWENFKVLECVGEGKFARVYKAELGKETVALRVLKVSECAVLNKRKFLKEAQVLISLEHPNIVKCLGVVLSKKCFVLEYCCKVINDEGEDVPIHSLLGLIRTLEEYLPLFVKVKVFHDVISALEFLHKKYIIAGDVKPCNILVSGHTNEWNFKLADFSPETLCRQQSTLMSTSFGMGNKEVAYTLQYLAPELITSNFSVSADQKTSASDIYAFSLMGYEVLFPELQLPTYFSPIHQMEAIRKNTRPKIPTYAYSHTTLKDLISIVEKCWDEVPWNRFTAKEIREKIELIQQVRFFIHHCNFFITLL